jgi:hypothetical protein
MGENPKYSPCFLSCFGTGDKCTEVCFLALWSLSGNSPSLKDLFLYSCKELTVGFKYLGYLLKPDSYKVEDWQWLFDKFETRINHWCNRWLSLGGRFVLIKAVLESQPVYWMALAHISISVLHRIRKLSISFLWSGNKINKVII